MRLIGALFAAALAVTASAPSHAASIFEKNFWLSGPNYTGEMPACEDNWALYEVSSRFSLKESRFWNSELRFVSFENIQETAYRPWARDAIPRRYCTATVLVNDGVRRKIYYWIGEDTGAIGATWGVESCVVGLDRNWAFNPGCKMARP
jgi:hypothetical protein